MARKKPEVEQLTELKATTKTEETVLIWQAKQPLSETEHEQLSNKLRFEQEKSGIKIVLVPFAVNAAVDDGLGDPAGPEGYPGQTNDGQISESNLNTTQINDSVQGLTEKQTGTSND
ncbi:hypothetical protein EXW96_26440 [Paenibacillus sp. JMULE4]|uniref:hypothetical protein n=1 Tax=Paenibacillus sp. JMULE4 TaxID=2518342 RepID=UPI001576F201|nr:hypothetical protein [Paenibacillus sp. JMULE4]NTZ20929.1 hypothetical protein [Paenibacillus sp. JMULE4]